MPKIPKNVSADVALVYVTATTSDEKDPSRGDGEINMYPRIQMTDVSKGLGEKRYPAGSNRDKFGRTMVIGNSSSSRVT